MNSKEIQVVLGDGRKGLCKLEVLLDSNRLTASMMLDLRGPPGWADEGASNFLSYAFLLLLASAAYVSHHPTAPYQAIHVGAAAPVVPQALLDQVCRLSLAFPHSFPLL